MNIIINNNKYSNILILLLLFMSNYLLICIGDYKKRVSGCCLAV